MWYRIKQEKIVACIKWPECCCVFLKSGKLAADFKKAQAKKKFDVYPSAYANGWAAKKYKAAGGGWKKC